MISLMEQLLEDDSEDRAFGIVKTNFDDDSNPEGIFKYYNDR